jgi:predicted small lipoprotein YifL
MKLRTFILLFMILAFLGTQVGCGKKGPPVPPPVPPLIDKAE